VAQFATQDIGKVVLHIVYVGLLQHVIAWKDTEGNAARLAEYK